jgi:hypothetical protein
MTLADYVQLAACFLLPLGIFLIALAIHGPVLGAGFATVVLAVELWFIGREMFLQEGGDDT